MRVRYVGAEEILRLHYQVIVDFGGAHGVRDVERLKSVVGAPRQVVFGHEQYPSILDKAAVYLRNIIGDHPFVDGNKRTAITVCGIFLARNGLRLTASPSELEEFVIKLATDRLGIPEIAGWLQKHTK